MDIPPHLLDQQIARAATDLARARRALLRDGPEHVADPLRRKRAVSTRTTWLELVEKPSDPVYIGARDWVHQLTLARVLWPDAARVAALWHRPGVEVERPDRITTTPRDLLRRLLADRDVDRRALWGEALAKHAQDVSDAARIETERRHEASRLLADDPEHVELPTDTPDLPAWLANEILDRTASLDAWRTDRWTDALDRAMARTADAGWPARLTTRWVHDLFAPTELTGGLAIDLGTLPTPIGGASFARALARFGAAYAEADVPPTAPFVLAHRPFDLRRERRAALFGSLVADPLFGLRALGLGRDAAREQARLMARALLATLRLDAARVLLRGAIALDRRALTSRFEEVTERALGAPLPPSLAGALPALGPGDATRLCGAVLAATDRAALVDGFDEDWFRSPHAALAIRDQQSRLPASPRATRPELEAGLRELERSLHAVLG